MRMLDETDRGSERMARLFDAGYPHLSLEVSWRERARQRGVWMATVRVKDGGRVVSTGVRHHQPLAVGAALEGIPEGLRRSPGA
jgi:hypothetical protein